MRCSHKMLMAFLNDRAIFEGWNTYENKAPVCRLEYYSDEERIRDPPRQENGAERKISAGLLIELNIYSADILRLCALFLFAATTHRSDCYEYQIRWVSITGPTRPGEIRTLR